MDNPVFIALSSQMALRRHLEVVANNMANASTPGFKAERMMFREYLQDVGQGKQASFVQDIASYNDLSDGPVISTGADLDVAIAGKGYFTVDTPEGARYTRAGSFTLDGQRRVVNNQGYPVLTSTGTPIVLPADAMEVAVAEDGTVSTRGDDSKLSTELGKIGVVDFDDERQLRNTGDGLLATDQAAHPVEKVRVVQGYVEQSNVQGVREMTDMIEILRTYQIVQRVIDNENDRQRDAIQQLSRTTSA